MNGLLRLSRWLSVRFNLVAEICLVGMAFLTCSEIILRFLRKPIPGSYDIVGFLLAITIAFAMARTTLQRKHVAVQLLTMILSRRIQKIIFVL